MVVVVVLQLYRGWKEENEGRARMVMSRARRKDCRRDCGLKGR